MKKIMFNERCGLQLAVAWAYYDEITKGIADWMIHISEFEAWAWWPDKEEVVKEG